MVIGFRTGVLNACRCGAKKRCGLGLGGWFMGMSDDGSDNDMYEGQDLMLDRLLLRTLNASPRALR